MATPAQTNKTLKFIVDIISEGLRKEGVDPSTADIGVATIVSGHTTMLHTELVVKMGEEDPRSMDSVSILSLLHMRILIGRRRRLPYENSKLR